MGGGTKLTVTCRNELCLSVWNAENRSPTIIGNGMENVLLVPLLLLHLRGGSLELNIHFYVSYALVYYECLRCFTRIRLS